MAKQERASRVYMELIAESNKEVYKFWNIINAVAVGTFDLSEILSTIIETDVADENELVNLIFLSKKYPGTTITNCSGMPVITVKLL